MSDRYEPKLSVRPMSDRQVSEANKGAKAARDDPLVELAKIVSGRSGSGGSAREQRSRTVPAASAPARPVEATDVLGDLEAELLSDLQASFSTVKGTFAPAPSAPPPKAQEPTMRAPSAPPAPPSKAEEPTAPPPSAPPPPKAEEPTARPPTAPPAPKPEQPAARPPVRSEIAPAQPKPAAPATPVERPADVPSAAPAPSEPPAGLRPPVIERAEPRVPPPQKTAPPRPPASERPPQPPRTAAPSDSVDIPNLQLRATTPATPPPASEAPPRQLHSRWDKPAEPQKSPSSVTSRFAPPRAAAPVRPPVGDRHEDETEALGEGFPFAEASEDDAQEVEPPFNDFDVGPGFGDEDHLPPYPEDELESLVKRRSGRGRIALIAVVAVVLIGGVWFVMFRAGNTGDSPPPIITADGSPTKMVPEDSAAADGDQNKLIYDRVAPGDTEPDTTLITPGERPVTEFPPDANTDNPIARVIIPGGPGIDQPEPGGAAGPDAMADIGTIIDGSEDTPVAGETEPIQPIGPRRVRTVVVKPDGTIVSSQATDTGSEPPATDVVADVAKPEPVLPPAPPAETDNDTMAIAGTGASTDANGELTITPIPDASDRSEVAALDTGIDEPAVPPAPTAAQTGNQGPIDVTPGRPTPRPPVPQPTQTTVAMAMGGMLVQVSSQRSEDAARATFRDLQLRYPNILGSYNVDVQRADLGDRGIYYRARVGPFPPGDAERLCDDLKAAGGDCILARR